MRDHLSDIKGDIVNSLGFLRNRMLCIDEALVLP